MKAMKMKVNKITSGAITVTLLSLSTPGALFGQQTLSAWKKTEIAPVGSFSLGLEYDNISERALEDSAVTGVKLDDMGAFDDMIDPGTEARDVDLESSAVHLRLSYSFYAPAESGVAVESYLLLGTADVELDGVVVSPGDPTQSFNVDGDSDLSLGAGVRARVYKQGPLSIFADASFRTSDHDSDIRQVSNLDLDLGVGETAVQDFETSLTAWQISSYAAYVFERGGTTIAPYGGLRISSLEAEVDGEQSFFDPGFDGTQSIDYSADSEDDFGIFAGVEATFSNGINAFLELRTADESAVTIGISASF